MVENAVTCRIYDEYNVKTRLGDYFRKKNQDSGVLHFYSLCVIVQSSKGMNNLEKEKRGHRIFEEMDMVLVKIEPHEIKKSDPPYEGPFKILEYLSTHQGLLKYDGKRKLRRLQWLLEGS